MTAVERVRQWRIDNPGKRNATERKRYSKTKSKRLAYLKTWVIKNRKRRQKIYNKWRNRKRETDPNFRLKDNLRRRIRHALNGVAKTTKSTTLLGCSVENLKRHLEQQFTDGMTWLNYGKGADRWNIDHITPCANFNLTDPLQQQKCFHFSNLRPLWEPDNLRKGCQ